MNKVILMGRLTREPDVRYSQSTDSSMAIARYTLAVDRRRGKGNDNEQSADFISCVAFGRSGEFAESKGASNNGNSRPETGMASGDGFMSIPDGVDDEGLPFN